MPKLLIVLVVLFSAPLLADTRQEVTAAIEYSAQVWNENDIDALQGYYHEDFVLVNDAGTVSREQHLNDIRALIDDGGDRGEISYSDLEVMELGKGHALVYGRLSLSFKDGSSLGNWFTTVYIDTPFGWKALLTRN